MLAAIHRIASHPWMNTAVAVMLILTVFLETDEALIDPLLEGQADTRHGLFLLAIGQLMKSIPELVEGVEKLQHGPEARE